MFQIWDWLNISGILLQIIGFVLLLQRFIGWISTKVADKAIVDLEKTLDKTNLDLDHPVDLPRSYNAMLKNFPKRITEGIGIIIVILGLILQLISVIIEKI